jgi:hypothetical protein
MPTHILSHEEDELALYALATALEMDGLPRRSAREEFSIADIVLMVNRGLEWVLV